MGVRDGDPLIETTIHTGNVDAHIQYVLEFNKEVENEVMGLGYNHEIRQRENVGMV